jgi:hypothetical protein
VYPTSEKQHEKMLFLIDQMLEPESNGDDWKWKHTFFTPNIDTGECEEVRLVFIDKRGTILYYIIGNDGNHTYNYNQGL